MKWNNMKDYVRVGTDRLHHSFGRIGILWDRIQMTLKGSNKKTTSVGWKPLSGVTAAVVLGLLAVWGVHKYLEMTTRSPEIAASVHYYENAEAQLINSISGHQNLNISGEVRHDLQDIEQSQKMLKKALCQAPENKKEKIYSALVETYELKVQLLEKIISYDRLDHKDTMKQGASL